MTNPLLTYILEGYMFLTCICSYLYCILCIAKEQQEFYLKDFFNLEAIMFLFLGWIVVPFFVGGIIFTEFGRRPLWQSKEKKLEKLLYEKDNK